MTSNERKIINFLQGTEGKINVRLVAQKVNLSSDYVRLLCRSLARAGYIEFENDLCHLLKRERNRFDSSTPPGINPEPVERVENIDSAIEEPMVVAANVALIADEPGNDISAGGQSDKEGIQEEDSEKKKDEERPAVDNDEPDGASVDSELSAKKDESEDEVLEKEEKEEKEEVKEPEEEPKTEIESDREEEKEEEVRAETKSGEEAKKENLAGEPIETKPMTNIFVMSFNRVVNWFVKKK